MHRIDTAGSVAGQFTDGNPATGQQATVVDAAWLNAVQEAIARVIEFAGIALDKGDEDQLKDAVIALIAGVVGTGAGEVPTTRQVNGGGLVTGGGALAANLTLSVLAATAAEAAAQIRNDVAVTPASLAGLITVTGAAGTMIRKVGTSIEMTFSASVAANGTTVVTLPDTFPTECVYAECNGDFPTANAQDNPPWVSGRGTGSLSIYSPRDEALTVQIYALGR